MNAALGGIRTPAVRVAASRLAAAAWLLLALPLLCCVAVAVLVAHGGPVVTRVQSGRLRLFRFRVPAGSRIERYGLDRVPEIANVARGELALIGSRDPQARERGLIQL